MVDNKEWQKVYIKHYKKLDGYTIQFYEIDDEGFPQFVLNKDNKKPLIMTLSSDEEANSPGFAFID